MPERIGMASGGQGRPWRAAKAERELAWVLIAHAEPRHAVRAQDAQDRGGQNQGHLARGHLLQTRKVINHAYSDEHPQVEQELALLQQVALARLPNDVGNVPHRIMHGQVSGSACIGADRTCPR